NGPIALIPTLKNRIAQNYPGTRLSVMEYNFGGGQDISGGVAQADVLGIFAREGVFSAALWRFADQGAQSFTYGAFDVYLNYDGAGSRVGDVSVLSSTTDNAKSSVYAMVKSGDASTVYVVAINKTAAPLSANVLLKHSSALSTATAYQLTSASMKPAAAGQANLAGNQLHYVMPAYSVSTIILR
ncbi:MAG: endoglucanase A, partial [Deltaproteobacteria bacterium]|nr:endoglucanase A [Deltaproteobacteria bacterium]